MIPEFAMAQSLGAVGKRLIRVHRGFGGRFDRQRRRIPRLCRRAQARARRCMGEQSESNAMWALSIPVPFTKPVGAGAGGFFAPHVRAYIRRSGAPSHIGAIVAAKDRRNGALNPLAHLHQPDMTVEKIMESQMLWDPIRFDETCPVVRRRVRAGHRRGGRRGFRRGRGNPVAWIHATAMRTEPLSFAHRNVVNPQAGRDASAALWKSGGITNPIEEIDAAEIYVPFSWFEPMWLENLGFARGRGLEADRGRRNGDRRKIPFNASGGVLSSNPIGASGMIRFAEAAIQVMGRAATTRSGCAQGRRHAYGGGSQYFSMWLVGADKPEH